MTLRTRWRPTDRFLVRHKDAAILVVEKKAGLLTVRTESGRAADLLSLLHGLLGIRGRREGVFAVHRLDRVVSGLLVFARTREARAHLIEQFKSHSVERRYIAAASGLLLGDHGTYESRLVTDDPSLKVYSDESGDELMGRSAVTHWRVLERFERAKATLVEVALETGIRNQIRVHFAEAGHPLLGEQKYQPAQRDRSVGSPQGTRRIFLHAAVLGFVHPLSGEAMRFEAPLPPDLSAWRARLLQGSSAFNPAPGRRRRPRTRRRR